MRRWIYERPTDGPSLWFEPDRAVQVRLRRGGIELVCERDVKAGDHLVFDLDDPDGVFDVIPIRRVEVR